MSTEQPIVRYVHVPGSEHHPRRKANAKTLERAPSLRKLLAFIHSHDTFPPYLAMRCHMGWHQHETLVNALTRLASMGHLKKTRIASRRVHWEVVR